MLLPRLSALAALVLAGDMVGAFFNRLANGEFSGAALPLVLLALAGRPRRRR